MVGCWLLVVCCWLVVGCWLVGSWLLVVGGWSVGRSVGWLVVVGDDVAADVVVVAVGRWLLVGR